MKSTRRSVCERKRRYACEPDAIAAAFSATVALRPYRCDRGDHFHLTGRIKGKRRPVADRASRPL